MMLHFGHLAARPATEADQGFLHELYAATRADLLHLPVPRAVIDAITAHQRQLQAQAYAEAYPQAHCLVLEDAGVPVGRVVLDRTGTDLRLVDLAIVPFMRRKGNARAVLRALQERAMREGWSVSLRVRRDNAQARALYAGAGFRPVAADAAAEQLRWAPGDEAPPSHS
jgi:ribosomal protein S18 acetylase RimI-like enzyme